MKNLIIYSGISLFVLANIYNTSFGKNKIETSQESRKEITTVKGFKTEFSNLKKISTLNNATASKSRTLYLRNYPKISMNNTIGEDEPIVIISSNKMNKTADELIAEDNLITENNISNETQALDFDSINGSEVVEQVNISETEKTVDQLFAEDNAITENNISNETQFLDFDIINGKEVVESVYISKTEKNIIQLFEEDNAITENNISNETQFLDFEIINKIAKPRN